MTEIPIVAATVKFGTRAVCLKPLGHMDIDIYIYYIFLILANKNIL